MDFGFEHPDGRILRLSPSRSLLVDYDKLFGINVQMADMTGVFELHEREKCMIEENSLLQRHRAQGVQKLSMAVAHQIRNPLMTVGGFSDLLLRRLPQASAEAWLVAPILDSARRLEAVVEAVSTFAGVRVGQMRSTPLARLAREALEQAAALLPAPAAQARLATPDEGAETWILEFADNGPGVPEEHRPYVFDPFYSTRPLSVGMGLPMAERIAHEHGGTMDLSCPAGGGCLVRLFLPSSPRAVEHISP